MNTDANDCFDFQEHDVWLTREDLLNTLDDTWYCPTCGDEFTPAQKIDIGDLCPRCLNREEPLYQLDRPNTMCGYLYEREIHDIWRPRPHTHSENVMTTFVTEYYPVLPTEQMCKECCNRLVCRHSLIGRTPVQD